MLIEYKHILEKITHIEDFVHFMDYALVLQMRDESYSIVKKSLDILNNINNFESDLAIIRSLPDRN
jgi:hypothetical protein